MFDTEFFPTPSSVAYKMLEWYTSDQLREMAILEPSAWKWDLADAITSRQNWSHASSSTNIYCIEQNTDLQQILKWKGYRVVDSDFLEYEKDMNFDLIVMNPPFSNGDEHFLKAWDILENWEICCLLNEETIKNPFSAKRKLIAKILEDNESSVEYLWSAFLYAERKTNTGIALIRVKKVTKNESFEFDWYERERNEFTEDILQNELATRDMIQNIIDDYARAKDFFAKGVQFIKKAQDIQKSITWNEYYNAFETAYKGKTVKNSTITFIEDIKFQIWNRLAKELKIEKYMTSKLREDFGKYMREQGNLAISKTNIMAFAEMVLQNRWNILERAITEVFDLFTTYYKENRVYVEGWKTNDRWKVNKKIILPNWIEYNTWSWFHRNYSRWWQFWDVDKALCYITWDRFDHIMTIEDALEASFRGWDNVCYSKFFKIRYFKKWTVHLEFKDDWLWKEFNMRACHWKNWLPDWEKQKYEKERAERAGKQIQIA